MVEPCPKILANEEKVTTSVFKSHGNVKHLNLKAIFLGKFSYDQVQISKVV